MVLVPADVVVVVEGRRHRVARVKVHDAAWCPESVDSLWVERVWAFESLDMLDCRVLQSVVEFIVSHI